MIGLENSMDMAASATTVKKPKIDKAEQERQRAFLSQLRSRKPEKAKAKTKPKQGKKMSRARKDETYYCSVCGCEVVCVTESESPLVCCDEIMYFGLS